MMKSVTLVTHDGTRKSATAAGIPTIINISMSSMLWTTTWLQLWSIGTCHIDSVNVAFRPPNITSSKAKLTIKAMNMPINVKKGVTTTSETPMNNHIIRAKETRQENANP